MADLAEKEALFCMEINWNELVDEYLLELAVRGYSQRTTVGYRSKLKQAANIFTKMGIVKPLLLQKNDVKKLILFWKEMGHQASTINKGLTLVKGMYDYCLEEGYVAVNPCTGVRKLREKRKIIYPLNDREIKQVLAAAEQHPYPLLRHRNKVILMLLLDCGLRIGDVEHLNEEDVLQNQLYIKEGKNRKERAVALSPVMKKSLMQYLRVKHSLGFKNEALIVTYQDTRMARNGIWLLMQKLAASCDIREEVRFSPHTLRHTYAAMQIRNGLDIHTLSLNMGHENIGITQTYLRSLHSEDFIEQSLKTSTLMNLR